MSTASAFPHEQEVLLPPGTPFRIADLTYGNRTKKTTIHLQTTTYYTATVRSLPYSFRAHRRFYSTQISGVLSQACESSVVEGDDGLISYS
ncbi:unnamed protein product [Didymodactylos carnosus]|uniref:Uncharacterized protein n=1 Tax=Didymodactylos carnosus TaxID=1234261 RepID=A0A815JGF3_9BILA|nr:unnamed protein product [Didymodactylos carnosus]CAF1380658.1 unnamed protein product [Didymodactylos carnosus]CAF3627732.1 unnamed protein product [Didymodactylos carnosus]CAF4275053.1 unnamed protein product [Didymodactylos carnosus]